MIRIASWNINSIRIRIDNIKKLADEFAPDIILLQETKVTDELFPQLDIISLGYPYLHFRGQKSYNGVAILSKYPFEKGNSLSLFNEDSRHIAIKLGDIEIHNFYIPAGGDEPDTAKNPKFLHKLEYVKEITKWFEENRSPNNKMILAGDLNIARLEHDVWSSKQLRNVISHTDIERELFGIMQDSLGWIDVPRQFVDSKEKLYSWWSYRNSDWKKSNRGRRLDHLWVTPILKEAIKSFIIPSEYRDLPSPSDHVPVIADLDIKIV